jgi:hypothetical protein
MRRLLRTYSVLWTVIQFGVCIHVSIEVLPSGLLSGLRWTYKSIAVLYRCRSCNLRCGTRRFIPSLISSSEANAHNQCKTGQLQPHISVRLDILLDLLIHSIRYFLIVDNSSYLQSKEAKAMASLGPWPANLIRKETLHLVEKHDGPSVPQSSVQDYKMLESPRICICTCTHCSNLTLFHHEGLYVPRSSAYGCPCFGTF